jgi:hypothetical protein
MSLATYHDIIASSRGAFKPTGFDGDFDLPASLFPHQRASVEFSLRAGSSAMFLDTGLGKTRAALAWGQEVVSRTNRPVLMLAPLGVTRQHKREADDIGIDAIVSRDGGPQDAQIIIANYERLHLFDAGEFAGIILDESSILKSFSGQTTKRLIETFSRTPYRLACTATPAPNDHTELGTHAEFLGVMTRDQMLMRWFLHDSADTGTWRLKGHGVRPFWDWVASWARCVSRPSDLGYSDDGFLMPELRMHRHLVAADRLSGRGEEKDGQAHLFRMPDMSATSVHREKRLTIKHRAKLAAEIVFGDWACRGNLNTPNADVPNIVTTRQSASGESSRAATPPITANTCGNTTSSILKNSGGHPSSKRQTTPGGVNDMPQTPHIAMPAKPLLEPGAPRSAETAAFGLSSGSTTPDTMPCSPCKVADAPSVGASSEASEAKSSPWTTVTQAGPSGASSAQTATRGSASSGTILNASGEPLNTSSGPDWWVIWCDTDYEQDELEQHFGDKAFSIRGTHTAEQKEAMHDAWLRGERKAIIVKPVMFGYGLNWQHCHKMVFVGLSFSYEAFYQAIRRCWRFRQTRPVDCHVVFADTEAAIWDVVSRKAGDHDAMKREMTQAMARAHRAETRLHSYQPQKPAALPAWVMT